MARISDPFAYGEAKARAWRQHVFARMESPEPEVAAAAAQEWLGYLKKSAERFGTGERIDLNVPYPERQQASANKARWDKVARTWYAPPFTPLGPLMKWIPEGALESSIRQRSNLPAQVLRAQ